MKGLLRVLALDDGSFKPRQKGNAILVGVISRFDGLVEGILSSKVSVNGSDSTKRIIALVKKSRFSSQVNFVLLDGIGFAGFNIVDLPLLSRGLGVPAIAVLRKRPNMKKIAAALSGLRGGKKKLALIEKAGPVMEAGKIFFQVSGADAETVKTVLSKTIKCGNLPEPLRLAHLVASGISRGESTRP
jgi:hypothetical protein